MSFQWDDGCGLNGTEWSPSVIPADLTPAFAHVWPAGITAVQQAPQYLKRCWGRKLLLKPARPAAGAERKLSAALCRWFELKAAKFSVHGRWLSQGWSCSVNCRWFSSKRGIGPLSRSGPFLLRHWSFAFTFLKLPVLKIKDTCLKIPLEKNKNTTRAHMCLYVHTGMGAWLVIFIFLCCAHYFCSLFIIMYINHILKIKYCMVLL